MLKRLVIVLIIAFSCNGCISNMSSAKWETPEKPLKRQVISLPLSKGIRFDVEQDGIFIDSQSAINLLYNIDQLDAYIEKQEKLIQAMKRYYGAR
jgi:hypothetical protein